MPEIVSAAVRAHVLAAVVIAVSTLVVPAGVGGQQPDPGSIRIETADVRRFLSALDSLGEATTEADSAAVLFRTYYYPGTPGLRDFIRSRIGSVFHLLDQIRARPGYYGHLRESLAGLEAHEPRIRAGLERFEALYPEAVFTDIYLVVGRMNSGGTVSARNILIGAEMYGRDEGAPEHELNDWEAAVLRDGRLLDAIAVHELMHINQPQLSGRLTLLQGSLREGGADFVTELVTGRNINAHVHEWAAPRRVELWAEFRERLNGTDMSGWLYDTSREDRPADLGYWIGYEIARAYYEGAEDKSRAIGEILGSGLEAEAFLERSGYAPAPAATDEACGAVVADPAAVATARDRLTLILEREPIPGAGIAVARAGEVLWSEGFGWADVAERKRVCRRTAFRAGSVSKVITGAALLRLHDAGTVDLDADVRALVRAAGWHAEPITLRQLAGHLAGIRHYGQGEYFNTRRHGSVGEGLGIFIGDSLQSPPGTAYLYSSYGYNLLGAGLEAAAGAAYRDVVRAAVLEPLRLDHTHPEWQLRQGGGEGDLATPYLVQDDSVVAAPDFDPSDRLPSGGWASSAEDLARLGAALASDDFLSAAARELMFTSQRTARGESTGYSLGFRIGADASGRRIAHHGGTSVGARAFLLVYPAERLAIAMLANGPARFDEADLASVAEPFLTAWTRPRP